eukprot:Nk52_evm32s24 gene=Nk52_evmTU32s24
MGKSKALETPKSKKKQEELKLKQEHEQRLKKAAKLQELVLSNLTHILDVPDLESILNEAHKSLTSNSSLSLAVTRDSHTTQTPSSSSSSNTNNPNNTLKSTADTTKATESNNNNNNNTRINNLSETSSSSSSATLTSNNADNSNGNKPNASCSSSSGSSSGGGGLFARMSSLFSSHNSSNNNSNSHSGSVSSCYSPSGKKGHRAVFGQALPKVANVEQIPLFLKHMMEYVEKNSSTQGIFRTSGSVQRIQKLRSEIESGRDIQQLFSEQDKMLKQKTETPSLCAENNEVIYSVHDVASVIKMFFRELPEPLMTFRLHSMYISSGRINNEENKKMAAQLLNQLLPEENRVLLYYLLQFLSKIACQSASSKAEGSSSVEKGSGNLMNSHNLAIVFGPNILRSKDGRAAPRHHNASTSSTSSLLTDMHIDSKAATSSTSLASSAHERSGHQQRFNDCVEETEVAIDLIVLMIDNANDVCNVPEQIQRDLEKYVDMDAPAPSKRFCCGLTAAQYQQQAESSTQAALAALYHNIKLGNTKTPQKELNALKKKFEKYHGAKGEFVSPKPVTKTAESGKEILSGKEMNSEKQDHKNKENVKSSVGGA